jgi:predicted enzyme related to lactoylglutathione lyase
MIVLATDAPLSPRDLERLASRAVMGLARTGSFMANGSGDFVIAFSTENHVPHEKHETVRIEELLYNDFTSPLFLATVEAVEEAVLNSIVRATSVTGRDGHTVEAIDIDRLTGLIEPLEAPVSQTDHDKKIDYIELPTTDMAAVKTFYERVFGWEMQDWGPDYASFEDGRLTGGFRMEETVEPGGTLVVIYAVDLEAAEAAVRAAGGEIMQEIFSFPGGRRFQFRDPVGNELAVWSDQGLEGPE